MLSIFSFHGCSHAWCCLFAALFMTCSLLWCFCNVCYTVNAFIPLQTWLDPTKEIKKQVHGKWMGFIRWLCVYPLPFLAHMWLWRVALSAGQVLGQDQNEFKPSVLSFSSS